MFKFAEFEDYLRHIKQADEEFQENDVSVAQRTPHEQDVTYKFFMEDIYHYLLTYRAYRRVQKGEQLYYRMDDTTYARVTALLRHYYPEYGDGLLQVGTRQDFDKGVHN